MSFLQNQKGVVNLAIIAVFVLAVGLFAASRLASISDLTFFNIAEEAKGVDKANCAGTKNGYALRWDRKSETCKKKEQSGLLKALKKNIENNKKVSECKSGLDCSDKKIGGSKACISQGSTIYCCPSGQKDFGSGTCEGLSSCNSSACSEKEAKGSVRCQDSNHPNGWFCCPKGKHLLSNINTCSSLAGSPPTCPTSECSGSLISGSSLCVTSGSPEGKYCCSSGKRIVNGACQ